MLDETPTKRKRVTADILEYSTSLNSLSTSDLTNGKLISQDVEKLKHENFTLRTKLENLKSDAEARAMYHLKKSQEANELLFTATKDHEEERNKLKDEIDLLKAKLSELTASKRAVERENERLVAEKELDKSQSDNTINSLTSSVNSLKNMLKERSDTIQQMSEKMTTLTSTISELNQKVEDASKYPGDPKEYKKLEEQYLRVCEQNQELVSESKKMTNKLSYYEDIVNELAKFKDDNMTIKESLEEISKIRKENTRLTLEVAKYKAEREEWTCYLDTHPELGKRPPQSVIRELMQKVLEDKYLRKENEALQQRISDAFKITFELENHIDELKKKVLEYKTQYQLVLVAKDTIARDKETLHLHIKLLQNQLKMYDQEEKTYMTTTYDEKKSARIEELEALLKQMQERIEEQSLELANIKLNASPNTEVPKGPSDEVSSGASIKEMLANIVENSKTHFESISKLIVENDMLIKKMQGAEKRCEILSEAMSQQQNMGAKDKSDTSSGQRILQFTENPDNIIRAVRSDTLKRLQEENRLFMEQKLNAATDSNDYIPVPKTSILNFRKEIESKDKRISRLLTVWENKLRSLHETIQGLLGYKVTLRNDGIASLESSFVDKEHLMFLVNINPDTDEARIRITGSDKDYYMDTLLQDAYHTYIEQGKSIPAFLNAANQELYVQYKQKQEENDSDHRTVMEDDEMYYEDME
ncbi:unnamed protein product [Rhizopus microsporus]